MIKNKGLLFKFGLFFIIFLIVTLTIFCVTIFLIQNNIYKDKFEKNAHNIASYLEKTILSDPDEFLTYQNYLIEHRDEIDIPVDFDNYLDAKSDFYSAFSKEYPNESYNDKIAFDDMTDELKELYIIYRHEYFTITFRNALEAFDAPYLYYIVPSDEEGFLYYVLSIEKTARLDENGKETDNMLICDLKEKTKKDVPVLYKVWEKGEDSDDYDTFSNNYMSTNSYYNLVKIDDKKVGIICVDIDVSTLRSFINSGTSKEIFFLGIVLISLTAILLGVINKNYISRLVSLQNHITEYTKTKDYSIAKSIEKEVVNEDEISTLSTQVSEMIIEIENYVGSLLSTTKELKTTQILAEKDALTGVRNKTAYDRIVDDFNELINSNVIEPIEFGLAMVDLNFLKVINDTYGHETGNIALKKICSIVCLIFSHSPVFRIGGDEFVIILENYDLANIKKLIKEFHSKVSHATIYTNDGTRCEISASIGYAIYDDEIDKDVDSVFNRADKAMYNNKKKMEAVRKN